MLKIAGDRADALSQRGFRVGAFLNTNTLIQKVWNFCHTLRDDGVGYGDYLEQVTYLLSVEPAAAQAE